MLSSLFFIFLFFPILPVSSYTFTPTEIRDLESTTNLISQEALSWTITNKAGSSSTTDCSGSFILGGPGIISASGSYSRTYSSLASHNNIFYSFSFWIMDITVLDGNLFSIYFDSSLVGTWNGGVFLLTPSSNYCGQSQSDFPSITLSGTFPHQASSLTIKIQSLISSFSSASFGFRDVSLLFTTSNPVPPASACQFGNLLVSNSCLCPKGQTGSGSILGGCSSCTPGCESCITGSSTCTSCPDGSSFNGVNCFTCNPACDQCTGPLASDCIGCKNTQFLAWDNTCKNSCDLPYRASTKNGKQICDLPCDGNKFYWNNACHTSCPDPLVPDTTSNPYKTCKSPCGPSSPIYNVNLRTCVASCSLPERTGTFGDLPLCRPPCDNPNDFSYWDNTCKSSCDLPLVQGTSSYYKTCSLPCTGTQLYHVVLETCVASCDLPERSETQGDLLVCKAPCDSSDDFLYWNGTCDSNCGSPLVKGTSRYYKTCALPCPTASEYYYTSEGNCQVDCTDPNIKFYEGDLKTCSPPCSNPNDYFYWTRACLPSCLPPLVSSVDSFSKKYCNLPCDNTEFLYQDKSCRSSCTSPYIPGLHPSGLQLCNRPCPVGQFLVNGTVADCQSSCNSPSKIQNIGSVQVCIVIQKQQDPDDSPPISPESLNNIDQASSATAAVTSLLSAGNPTALFIIALADLMKYIRYIDVKFPAKVEKMFEGDLNTLLSVSTAFGFDLSDHIDTAEGERKLPHVFQKRELTPSFLINEFDEVVFMLICITIGLILFPISWLISRLKSPRANSIIGFISTAFRWNFFLLFFFGNFDDITLFSILQFHFLRFGSAVDFVSFFLCLFMIGFGGFLLWKTAHISKKTLAGNSKVHPLEYEKEDFGKIHKGYRIMFEPYKDRAFIQRGHLFFFTIRIILCYVIIGVFYKFPIAQMTLLTLINIGMIAYVAVLKPMKETLNMIESLVFELLLFVVNICVLIYTIIDKKVDPHAPIRNQIGSVIVFTNVLVRLVSLIFVLYSLITEGYALLCEKFPWIKEKMTRLWKRIFPCLENKSTVKVAKVMDLDLERNLAVLRAAKPEKYRYSNQETAASPSPVYPKKKKNAKKIAPESGSKVYIGEKTTSNLLRLQDPTIIIGNDIEENMLLGVLSPGQGSHTDRVPVDSTVNEVTIMNQEQRKSTNNNLKSLLISEFALELTKEQSNQSNQNNQLPLTKAGSIENNSLLQLNIPGGVFDPFDLSFQNTGRNSQRNMSVGDVTPGKSPSLSNLLQGTGSESSRTLNTLSIWKLQKQNSTDSEGSNSGTSNLLMKRFVSNEFASPLESKEDLTDRDIVLRNTESSRASSLSFVDDRAEKRNKRVNRRLAGLTENLKIEKQKSEQAKQEQQNEAGAGAGAGAWDKQISVKTGGRRTKARLSTIIEAPKVVSLEEVASPVKLKEKKKKKKIGVDFKFGSKEIEINEEKGEI